MTWFPLQSADARFFDTAPVVHRFPIRLAVPVQRVWDSLASDQSLAAWGPAIRTLRWTSPRPLGVGATRELTLALGAAAVREEFFRWDEGEGYSFFVRESNRPGLRCLAEDYTLEATGTGALLTWTVALQGQPWTGPAVRLGAPLTRAVFGRVAGDCRRYFARTA